MSDTEPSGDKDISSAASFLMVYAALVGIIALISFLGEGWPSDKYAIWYVGIPALMFLALSLIAWGVQYKKRWAWIPAMFFSLIFLSAFPIGTIISCYVLIALWRQRHRFYPFANRSENVPSKLKGPSLGFLVCLFIFGIPYAVGGYAYVGDTYMPSKVVRALPEGAMDIEEHYEWGGITGDFVRLVKARIPKDQVAAYAARMGATSPVKKEMSWENLVYWSGGPKWWKPPKDPLYFYSSEQGYRLLVGWENGFVYYDAVEW